MENEVIDVRVVATETDRLEQIKGAAIAGVVTVLVTVATQQMLHNLVAKAQARRERKAKNDESTTTES